MVGTSKNFQKHFVFVNFRKHSQVKILNCSNCKHFPDISGNTIACCTFSVTGKDKARAVKVWNAKQKQGKRRKTIRDSFAGKDLRSW